MKKRILMLLLIVLLTGCTTKSEVKVDYDGNVNEKVTVLTNTVAFKNDRYSIKQMIESVLSNYSKALEFRGYKSKTIEGKKESGAFFTNDYKDICSYFQNTGFNQYVYQHISCKEDDKYIIIKNDTKYIPYCENCSNWPSLNKIRLEFTLPVKALENNADSIKNKTYIWNYDESTTNKDFYLKISKNDLNKNKIRVEHQNRNKKIKNTFLTILTIILVLGCLSIVSLILYKKYKNNRLEY